MITTITLAHAIDPHDLARQNTKAEILAFILDLDAAIQEVAFSKQLILKLAENLREDVSNAEMQELAKSISEIGGDL